MYTIQAAFAESLPADVNSVSGEVLTGKSSTAHAENAIKTVNNVKMIELSPVVCYHRAKIEFINAKVK